MNLKPKLQEIFLKTLQCYRCTTLSSLLHYFLILWRNICGSALSAELRQELLELVTMDSHCWFGFSTWKTVHHIMLTVHCTLHCRREFLKCFNCNLEKFQGLIVKVLQRYASYAKVKESTLTNWNAGLNYLEKFLIFMFDVSRPKSKYCTASRMHFLFIVFNNKRNFFFNILNLEIGNRNKISTQLITWGEIKTILRVLDYRIEMVLTEHSCVAFLATSIASSLTSLIVSRFGLDFPISSPTSAKGKMEKY